MPLSLPKPNRRLGVAVAVLALAGLGFGWSRARASAPQPKPTDKAVLTVSTQTVALRPFERSLALTGTVAAWDLISINPAVGGLQIKGLYAEEGQHVQRGQRVAQLDSAMLEAQLMQAKARLVAAEANVTSSLDAYRRAKELFAEGVLTPAELTVKEAALASARASVAAEKAGIRQIQVQLAQTRVVAPAAGLIIQRDAHLGDIANPGQRLFQLVRDNRYELQAQVPEADLAGLRAGQTVSLQSDADPGLSLRGTVRLVRPAVDATSRQGLVKIDLAAHPSLKAGMFLRGQVTLGQSEVVAVPAASIQYQEGVARVMVMQGGAARSRTVQVGGRSNDWVEIRSGLQPGEALIVNGTGYLKDGDRVRVAPAIKPAQEPGA